MKPTARAKALGGGQECPPSRAAGDELAGSRLGARAYLGTAQETPRWTPSPPSDGGEGRGEVAPLGAGLPLSPTLSPLVPRRAREAHGVVPRGALAAPRLAGLLNSLVTDCTNLDEAHCSRQGARGRAGMPALPGRRCRRIGKASLGRRRGNESLEFRDIRASSRRHLRNQPASPGRPVLPAFLPADSIPVSSLNPAVSPPRRTGLPSCP